MYIYFKWFWLVLLYRVPWKLIGLLIIWLSWLLCIYINLKTSSAWINHAGLFFALSGPDSHNCMFFTHTKTLISSEWSHDIARKVAIYFKKNFSSVSRQFNLLSVLSFRAPLFFFVPQWCAPKNTPLSLLHAPTLLVSKMMANSSGIDCQLYGCSVWSPADLFII